MVRKFRADQFSSTCPIPGRHVRKTATRKSEGLIPVALSLIQDATVEFSDGPRLPTPDPTVVEVIGEACRQRVIAKRQYSRQHRCTVAPSTEDQKCVRSPSHTDR